MALNFLNDGYFAGKVGIGTESPTTSLHVDSVSAFPTLTLARSTTHSGISFTAGISNYTGAGADLLFDGVGSNTGFGFRTRNSSNTQVNALVIAPSGNVGVGTTGPIATLQVGSITATAMSQVVGKARIVGTNYIPSSTQMGTLDIASTTRNSSAPFNQGFGPSLTFSQSISGYVNGYEVVIGAIKSIVTSGSNTGQESAMTFLVNGGTSTGVVERMRIAEDGNVGIGITTPQAPLSFENVAGNKIDFYYDTSSNDRYGIQVQPSELRIHSGAVGQSTGGITFGKDDGTTFTEAMRITNAGGISFGSTGTAYGTSGQILKSNGNASPTWIDGSAIPGVPAGSGTTNYLAKWTPDGDTLGIGVTYDDGTSVGIGTTSPGAKFNVVNNNTATWTAKIQNNTNIVYLSVNDANNYGIYVTGETKNHFSGNVGIGTVSPGQKLVVQGSNHFVTFTNPSTTANHYTQMLLQAGDATNYIWTANQNSTNWAGARSLNIYTAQTGANIGFFTEGDANNTKLMILGNGNVGIGTNSPNFPLEVLSASAEIALNASGGSIYRLRSDSTDFFRINKNGVGDRLVISGTGNVGIGATSPSEKLDVAGNIKITAAVLSNQENTDVDTGTETVAEFSAAAFTAGFFDFVIKKTTNVRSGTVYACHDGTNVEFTETSTQDLGDTSDVTLSVDISGGNMRLRATTTSDDWSVKSLIRAI